MQASHKSHRTILLILQLFLKSPCRASKVEDGMQRLWASSGPEIFPNYFGHSHHLEVRLDCNMWHVNLV